jgi:hypothetical protein
MLRQELQLHQLQEAKRRETNTRVCLPAATSVSLAEVAVVFNTLLPEGMAATGAAETAEEASGREGEVEAF